MLTLVQRLCQTNAVYDASCYRYVQASGRTFGAGVAAPSGAAFLIHIRYYADEFDGLVSLVEYAVHLIGGDKNDMSRLEKYFSILVPYCRRAFKYKYLMFPIVLMEGGVASRFYLKDTHYEVGGALPGSRYNVHAHAGSSLNGFDFLIMMYFHDYLQC